MAEKDPVGSRVGPFLLGGLVGWLAAAAASRLRGSGRGAKRLPGLSAFEAAPCFVEAARQDLDPPEGEASRPPA